MTPAIKTLQKASIAHNIHSYQHDPDNQAYGEEAAIALGIEPHQVFKTLLVSLNGDNKRLAVAVVPVSGLLNLKAMASALNTKKVAMANPSDAERATGYIVGGISPLGQKKRLPMVIDDSALELPTIFISAGRRGLEIELAAQDIAKLCSASFAPIGRE